MWTLINIGGDGSNYGEAHKEFMLSAESDINTEPQTFGAIAPGSLAFLPSFSKIWQKDADGTWVEVGDE